MARGGPVYPPARDPGGQAPMPPARDPGGQAPMPRVMLADVLLADDTLVCALNSTARRSPTAAAAVGRLAAWLAGVEVVLMLALALAGRRDSAVRMLVAVGLVYLLSNAL